MAAMKEAGASYAEVARAFRIKQKTASSMITRYKRRQRRNVQRYTIEVDACIHADLEKLAFERKVNLNKFVDRLLSAVIMDDLTNAILDEGSTDG